VWFTDQGNDSIGRISARGKVTIYTGPGISSPAQITAGPHKAPWFINAGNDTIGRITTTGTVTSYTGPGIDGPRGITTGPGGSLWFTNYNNTLGRLNLANLPGEPAASDAPRVSRCHIAGAGSCYRLTSDTSASNATSHRQTEPAHHQR
jgi:virginiamycin B lyase